MKDMKSIEKVADMIAKECKESHDQAVLGNPQSGWNPAFGRWLVYGFERAIGFADAAQLEEEIESAYRSRKDIKLAALHFFVKRNLADGVEK